MKSKTVINEKELKKLKKKDLVVLAEFLQATLEASNGGWESTMALLDIVHNRNYYLRRLVMLLNIFIIGLVVYIFSVN